MSTDFWKIKEKILWLIYNIVCICEDVRFAAAAFPVPLTYSIPGYALPSA